MKFKPARIIPKLFSGIPLSGASYDLSAYSANTIAPYELSLNTSAQTIVVNFGGTVLSFAPTGGTTFISAVTSNLFVYRTGDTMSGSLTMSAGTSVRFMNSSGGTGQLVSDHIPDRVWRLPNDSGTIGLVPKSKTISGSYAVTSAYQVYFVDTSPGVCKPDLPAHPVTGETYWFYDARSNFSTAGLELNGNGNNINGSTPLVLTASNKHVQVIFNGTQWSAFISA